MQAKDYFLLACLLVAIVSAYVALSPRFAHFIYRTSLFRPLPLEARTAAPVVNGIKGEDVEMVQAPGITLHAWFFQKPGTRYTAILSHGNLGNISTRVELINALLQCGLSVLAYDYCGYGKSTGVPDCENVCNSACCAYDYLVAKRHIRPEQIVLYGQSLGGAISVELAVRRPVRALIIQSSFTSLRDVAIEHTPVLSVFPAVLFPQPELTSAKNLAKLKLPVLIIHGVQDKVVPYRHGQDLYKMANEPKTLVTLKLCAHSDILVKEPEQFIKSVTEFVAKLDR